MDASAVFVLNAHDWPVYRRLAMTGRGNTRYRHGRYTNRRRWRLEKPLNHAMRHLAPANLRNLHSKIEWLTPGPRERARALYERLGDFFPGRWALQTRRHQDHRPAWYVPRRSWAVCAAWLRLWRAFERLVFLGATLISRPMSTPMRRGEIQDLGRNEMSGFERRKSAELARFRAWCAGRTPEGQPVT